MVPKISVIVPVYNAEKYLHRCIDSILAQTFTDFELLLINDGSKDSSGDICDEYAVKDSRVRVFHKPNGGVSSARNLGLDNVNGEWISFVDADDWIEPQMLELLLSKAKETNADIVFSDFNFDYPDRSIVSHFYDWNKQDLDGLSEYISTTWTCLWGSIQKKSLYDDNNLRSPEGVKYCEDFHIIVQLCFFADKIAKVSEPLYHYRQQECSIMHNLNKKTEKDEQWVYADIIRFFKEKNVYNDFKQVMAWRSLKASQELMLNGNTFDNFCAYNPDKKDYIFDCPFIGKKLKIIAWCITHDIRGIATAIISMRNLLGR